MIVSGIVIVTLVVAALFGIADELGKGRKNNGK